MDRRFSLLCESFSFHGDDRYQFAPTDRVIDIYQAVYPRWKFWMIADSMELEALALELDEQFGVNGDDWTPEITLGNLLEKMESETPNRPCSRLEPK